jgi:hypothetical protein
VRALATVLLAHVAAFADVRLTFEHSPGTGESKTRRSQVVSETPRL